MSDRPSPYDEADRAFARFAAHGEPEDLARVYDRLAPRLLLLGYQLVGDRATAEDLVQQTFVEAIGSAARFEPGRPIAPWLTTILTRRAANELRRRGRQRIETCAGVDATVATMPTPGRHAELAEAAVAIRAALEAMPVAWRQALSLHLLHGMRPVDVARALERPLGTVNAQLSRGLRRLRGLLPAGLAAAVSLAGDPRAQAVLRARVLAAVPKPEALAGSAAVAATTLGVLLMNKLNVSILALTSCGALLALVFAGRAADAPLDAAGTAGSTARTESATVSSEAIAAWTSDPAARDRRLVRSPVDALAPALPDGVTFTGRLVAAEDRSPLAGASAGVDQWFDPHWETLDDEPAPVSTDTDGRFVLSYATPPGRHHTLRFAAANRRAHVDTWQSLRQAAVIDVGELALEREIRVSVRFEDASGAAFPGVRFELQRTDGRAGGTISIRTADDKGEAELPLAPATYRMAPYASGLTVVAGNTLAVALDAVDLRHRVVLEPPDPEHSATLRVVDDRGEPAGEIDLTLESETGEQARVVCDASGRGWLPPMPPGMRRLVVVAAEGTGPERRLETVPLRPEILVGAGEQRLVVRAAPRTAWTLVVADADGNPVEAFRHVLVEPDWMQMRLPPRTHHADGVVTERPWAGARRLFVQPDRDDLAPVLGVPVDLPAHGEATTRVTLLPWRTIAVRVVDQAGRPVANSRLRLVEHCGGERDPHHTAIEVALRGERAGYRSFVTATARTDGDGRATLRCRDRLALATLIAEGRDHVPARHDFEGRSAAPLVVTVDRGVRVEGMVTPVEAVLGWGPAQARRDELASRTDADAELDAARVHVRLRRSGTDRVVATTSVADDGSFGLPCVPVDDFELDLDLNGGGTMTIPVTGLRLGETRAVRIDADGRQPARLHGTATVDGRVPRDLYLRIEGTGPTARVDHRSGRFEFDRIPPGTRTALARVGTSRTLWFAPAPLEFTPGAALEARLAFVTRTLRVRVVDADGAPAAGHVVCAAAITPAAYAGRIVTSPVVTDADGRAVLASIAHAPLDIVVFPPRARVPHALDAAGVRGSLARHGPIPVEQPEVTIRLP